MLDQPVFLTPTQKEEAADKIEEEFRIALREEVADLVRKVVSGGEREVSGSVNVVIGVWSFGEQIASGDIVEIAEWRVWNEVYWAEDFVGKDFSCEVTGNANHDYHSPGGRDGDDVLAVGIDVFVRVWRETMIDLPLEALAPR